MTLPVTQQDQKLRIGDCLHFYGKVNINNRMEYFPPYTRAKVVSVLDDGLKLQIENPNNPDQIGDVYFKALSESPFDAGWRACREPQSGAELARFLQERIKNNEESPLAADHVTLSLLVDRKRWRRCYKSEPIPNIFVLRYSKDQSFNELGDWLKLLKTQCKTKLKDFRAQLVVEVFPEHWVAVDVMVLDGQVFTLIIEAGNTVRVGANILDCNELTRYLVLSELNKNFPKGKHYSFSPGLQGQLMQWASEGSDVFAMEHASKLSKIDSHKLYASLKKISLVNGFEGVLYRSLTMLSSPAFTFDSMRKNPEAAKVLVPLIAATQSLTILNSLPEKLKQEPVGKNNQSLDAYVGANTTHAPSISIASARSHGRQSNLIKNKSYKRAGQLIDEYADITQDQFDAVKMFSSGILLVENPRLLAIYNNPLLWNEFIVRVKNSVPGLGLSKIIRSILTKSPTQKSYKDARQDFLDFKVVLFHFINTLHSYSEICADQIKLGRALNFSEYYPEDYLPENLQKLVELDLNEVTQQIEALIESMPLKPRYSPAVFGIASKHSNQHVQMQEALKTTKSKLINPNADNFNEAVEKHKLLKSFVNYSRYIQENGKRSQEILESFAVSDHSAEKSHGT